MLGTTGLVLTVTVAITAIVAIRLVRPLRALTNAARDPSGRHLRIPITTKDEIGYLAAALNELSERRERTDEQRRVMVSDIAHELPDPAQQHTRLAGRGPGRSGGPELVARRPRSRRKRTCCSTSSTTSRCSPRPTPAPCASTPAR
ncbi:hypothetical protein GCM10023238_05960 [Streptomyces heliomycini]